ncbi:hypothetical protein HanRHA438_Chr02g0088541 [Helianthus annuus]|nr:hypothetical protein HanIR_Chr02g0090061 [Helianthus annuus]KAJ0940892.1 hypothetical protein HanRHA438_Chr02g0088541 [Helianthus annuus]
MHRDNHPILKFEEDTLEYGKFEKLKDTELLQNQVINWKWLNEIGAEQEVRELLGERLIEALNCIEPQYEELVLEFHSTWVHKEGRFDQGTAVSFSFGRRMYEMNVPRFAVVSGLYTEEEVKRPEFASYLRDAYKKRRDCSVGGKELEEFWKTISNRTFGLTNLITSVRNPVYRYVLKILSTTLVGRKSGENKANWIDLFILMCRVQGKEFNLATVLADSFSRGRRGGIRAGLDMGSYITRIATNLGVFDTYLPEFLHEGPTTAMFGLQELQKAGIVSWQKPYGWEPIKEGPHVQTPHVRPAKDASIQTEPSHKQQPPQVHERSVPESQRRHPLPEPLTLSFSGYVEQRFDRLEQLIEVLQRSQSRQEDVLHYMMTVQSMRIPDFFRPGQEGQAGVGAQADPNPPFQVFEASSHDSNSGQ